MTAIGNHSVVRHRQIALAHYAYYLGISSPGTQAMQIASNFVHRRPLSSVGVGDVTLLSSKALSFKTAGAYRAVPPGPAAYVTPSCISDSVSPLLTSLL